MDSYARALLSLSVFGLGCSALPSVDEDGARAVTVDEGASTQCILHTEAELATLVASDHGVALAVRAGDGVVITRLRGRGCELDPDGSAPVAAARLHDMDDAGNLYVAPTEAAAPGVLGTASEGHDAENTVARVSPSGVVSTVVHAGRGIWWFGVSPDAALVSITACGPTGLFSLSEDGLTPWADAPAGWDYAPSVLTSDALWSVDAGACVDGAASCSSPLVRTSAKGSAPVESVSVDFGAGPEPGRLVRCGDSVCSVHRSGFAQRDASGAVALRVTRAELGLEAAEELRGLASTSDGFYALTEGPSGTRVRFVSADDLAE